ncbi:MAG: metallophosphoesterase family protein [Kiritimatiellae bacterium]|nr:metallophosphoesterase family protein [Kiritimatiellia bacterium]
MQYAIVSDIHANIQAWNAVLIDIKSLDIDEIISLGDLVGYGPSPAEVLKSVHTNINHFVLGNHDAVICEKLDTELFNDRAKESIEWTQQELNKNAIEFLRSIPLSLSGDNFRCAHGDFHDPASFNYVIEPDEAMPSWDTVAESLLFAGHTHQPNLFLLGASGIPHLVEPEDFELEEGKRFFVNVGSVGHPRDTDIRASYCIFDTSAKAIYWRRISFDIDAYRQELQSKGLTLEANQFLENAPGKNKQPLRETLNFSPATTADQRVQGAEEVRELTVLKQTATKWKRLFVALLILALTTASTIGFVWYKKKTRGLSLMPRNLIGINAEKVGIDTNLLSYPTEPVSTGNPIRGWEILLTEKRTQSVAFEYTSSQINNFLIASTSSSDIHLTSHPIHIKPDMKFCLEAWFRKAPDFKGTVTAGIILSSKTDTEETTSRKLFSKEAVVKRKGGWVVAKKTFIIPEQTDTFRVQIKGNLQTTNLPIKVTLVKK